MFVLKNLSTKTNSHITYLMYQCVSHIRIVMKKLGSGANLKAMIIYHLTQDLFYGETLVPIK